MTEVIDIDTERLQRLQDRLDELELDRDFLLDCVRTLEKDVARLETAWWERRMDRAQRPISLLPAG